MKSSQLSYLLFSSYIYPCTQLPSLSLLFLFTHFFMSQALREIPYGLAVRIPGFHPGGPGSTPGMGTHILSAQTLQLLFLVFIKH